MKKLLLYSFLLVSFAIQAQEKDKDLPKGNDSFADKKYADAEAEYRISESKTPKKSIASYNLGNAIYRQNQIGEAKYHYATALKNAKTRPEKHQAFHNMGNTFMKDKDYSNAVEAYKNALRNNPADEETRYNYALAKKMLKENPPKKDDKKDKDKNKDKKEDKKDGDKNKDNQDNKDKNQGKSHPQPGEISKQRLENLLDAVNNEEKKVQDKVNKQKVQANPKKAEKDW